MENEEAKNADVNGDEELIDSTEADTATEVKSFQTS